MQSTLSHTRSYLPPTQQKKHVQNHGTKAESFQILVSDIRYFTLNVRVIAEPVDVLSKRPSIWISLSLFMFLIEFDAYSPL